MSTGDNKPSSPKDALKNSYLADSILQRCRQSQQTLLGTHVAKNKDNKDVLYLNQYRHISYETLQSWQPRPFSVDNVKPMRVLGIAHTDCVPEYVDPVYDPDTFQVISGQLDDRLGVAILLDIIPAFMPWLHMDVLLTDDEETGQSTAENWIDDKTSDGTLKNWTNTYDWIFQFDRAGTDAVTYDYFNKDASELLRLAGWDEKRGSHSDIDKMYDLGLWGCNFGCGYRGQHTNKCNVYLDVLRANLFRFRLFSQLAFDFLKSDDKKGDNRKLLTSKKWNNYNNSNYYGGGYYNSTNNYKPQGTNSGWKDGVAGYWRIVNGVREFVPYSHTAPSNTPASSTNTDIIVRDDSKKNETLDNEGEIESDDEETWSYNADLGWVKRGDDGTIIETWEYEKKDSAHYNDAWDVDKWGYGGSTCYDDVDTEVVTDREINVESYLAWLNEVQDEIDAVAYDADTTEVISDIIEFCDELEEMMLNDGCTEKEVVAFYQKLVELCQTNLVANTQHNKHHMLEQLIPLMEARRDNWQAGFFDSFVHVEDDRRRVGYGEIPFDDDEDNDAIRIRGFGL